MRAIVIYFSLLLLASHLVAIPESELEAESRWLKEQGCITSIYGEDELARGKDAERAKEQESSLDERRSLGDQIRQETRDDLLDEVRYSWTRPKAGHRNTDETIHEEKDQLRSRLSGIHIPKVEFRQLPLSQTVEMLSEISVKNSTDGDGINIVLMDPENRNPRVSILLRRLSLKRVLDFVVESVGYEYELQSDAVVVRPRQGPGFGLETDFYPISRSTLIRLTGLHEMEQTSEPEVMSDPFAAVENPGSDERSIAESALKSFLQRAGVSFEGIKGADLALADGQLIVTQTPRNHEKLRQLLRRYREIKQVEIEARFLEVQERNLEELGFEWTLLSDSNDRISNSPTRNLANAFTIGQDESRIVIDRPGSDFPDIGNGAPVMPTTIDLASGASELASLQGIIESMEYSVLVRALERQSGNDLLSAPKLTVLSGKTAEIVVAEEFRYPEMYGDTNAEVGRGDSASGSAGVAITAGTPRSFATRNVGVEMEVTPTVEENDAISLQLKPKVTEFEGFVEYGGTSVAIASDTTVTVPSGFYQPVFSVRKVQTEVTIWDGATVVMGGLTREHAVRVKDKVPILGSLPLFGFLFRSEGESTQKRNLLIFVTANLVSPGGSPAFQRLPGLRPGSLFQTPRLNTPGGLKVRE